LSKNIVSIENLQKAFPGKVISENSTFGINSQDKIGLIGINGCGKSTFLKMLAGLEYPDSGSIVFRSNLKIGYLPQQPDINPQHSIYQHIYYSNDPEFEILREYHYLEATGKLHENKKLLEKAESIWQTEVKAKSILTKLGFSDLHRKIATLSGGQKRRLDLARVLVNSPDLLLLDEPTNHLDIETIEWFQNFLINYNGSAIFVTHDRYFLDAVSQRIMEIDQGVFHFYQGNYSDYIKQKQLQQIDLQRKETRRKAQLQKELRWLQRGAKARTSKPKNHLDRVKELLDKSYLSENKELDINFREKRLGKTILELKNVSKKYDNNLLFQDFSHIFQKQERIGILGPNGCGKTTLLKIITGEIEPSSGSIKVGINTKFAYFKQEKHNFDPQQSVLEFVKEKAEHIRTKDGILHSASEMLQKFLFDKKMQQNKLSSLSGGEKKRLFLLSSLMFGSNFIILDEPTNDLDIKTLEILEDYLDTFRGCILVVSHDRYFLDRVTDHLFVFEGRTIRKFPGNYSDYLLVKRYRDAEKKEKDKEPKKVIQKNMHSSQKLSYNEKRELEQLEKQIPELEKQLQNLEIKIETEAATLSASDFSEISQQQQQLQKELEEAETRWLELQEKV
jgi:ATP-binding cassette subfamily F protein uup